MADVICDLFRNDAYFILVVQKRLVLAEIFLESTDGTTVHFAVLAHIVPYLVELLLIFDVSPGKNSQKVIYALHQFPVQCLAVSVDVRGKVHNYVEHQFVDAHLLYHFLYLLVRSVVLSIRLVQFFSLPQHLVYSLLFNFFVWLLHKLDEFEYGSDDALLFVVPDGDIQLVLVGHVDRLEAFRIEHSEDVPGPTEFLICLHIVLVWHHHQGILQIDVECPLNFY